MPNQKVVCKNADFPIGIEKAYKALPKKDEIYTVRDIVPGCDFQGNAGEVAVYLHELHNPSNKKNIERGFNVERFEPLTEVTIETEEEIAALC